jgi:hypothetical protein
MDTELIFIDPAFRCEVVLTGKAKALYEVSRPQFDRLKGIRSLGLIAFVHDIAIHTRHQHLIGLMRLFNKLCLQPKGKGLPSEFLWSFWCRLCFAQAGHAAMSYNSEKAVLLACHHDSAFADELRQLVGPVIKRVDCCSTCNRVSCPARNSGPTDAAKWFDNLVSQNDWHRLHLWIAALKLQQEPKLTAILSSPRTGGEDSLGYSETEATKMLVAPTCEWDNPVRNLDRLDYIVRDLALAGTMGIQLDVDNLVAEVNTPHLDWKLLRSLSAYLSETRYESTQAQMTSMLFQRALAPLLITHKVTLETLFGLGSSSALSDQTLSARIRRTKSGREVFEDRLRLAWRPYEIETDVDSKRTLYDFETTTSTSKKTVLSQHTRIKVMSYKTLKPNQIAIAMRYLDHNERPSAYAIVKLCHNILKRQYPRLSSQDLTSVMYGCLLDYKSQNKLAEAITRLSSLESCLEYLPAAANVVHRRTLRKAKVVEGAKFIVGEHEYPVRSNPHEMGINVMHAALSGDDTVRRNFMSEKDAAEMLWKEILEWQSIYFTSRPSKELTLLLTAAQSALLKNVIENGSTAAKDLELYVLLEALTQPTEKTTFRITVPNLELLNGDGTPENEYDIVSVILKENKDVEVWVWGASIVEDIERKRISDLGKIQKLKNVLSARWGSDVRTVTCYAHRQVDAICLENDGRQDRRFIS